MYNYANVSTLYVSQEKGKPYYSGFSAKQDGFGNGPLPGIEEALMKVYQLRCGGGRQPVRIVMMDEEYYLSAPVSLEYEKLLKYRENDCLLDIQFESYGNRRCRVIGGKRLKGFQRDTFNGHACFSAEIPEVKSGDWNFTDLYVDGERAKLTRYPKEGTLHCLGTENPEGTLHTHSSRWFIARKEDLNHLSGIEDAIISYYHYWIDEHSPVESYDRETGKLTMKYQSRFKITNHYEDIPNDPANLEYYVENLPELFENPGEWYLDRHAGKLYYMPEREDQTPENICVYAPMTDAFFQITGTEEWSAEYIRFRGLDFICTKGDYASTSGRSLPEDEGQVFGSDNQSVAYAPGAINLSYAHGCSFEDCSFQNIGIHGICIGKGCSDIRIENCRFYDMGAGGIKIFGGEYDEEKSTWTHHNSIKNCEISHCGKRYAAGCGILLCHTSHNEILENTISYLDYSGISVGWVWGYQNSNTYGNRISKNHVHHIGMGNLSDMGGIYLLGKQRGTVVSENVIHDILGRQYGGWGIYTDEGSSYVVVERNLVYRASAECYHQHFGSNVAVRNNIFAIGGLAVVRHSIDEMHTGLFLEQNILVADNTPIFSAIEGKKGMTAAIQSHHNLIFDLSGKEPVLFRYEEQDIPLSEAQSAGYEQDSVWCDPKLSENFELSAESPVECIGFQKI